MNQGFDYPLDDSAMTQFPFCEIADSAIVQFPASQFARDVVSGLTSRNKRLPSMYLYDDLGSTLFDAICLLPEYKCTRSEKAILRAHANDIIALIDEADCLIAELGGGNGEKAAIVLSAQLDRYQRAEFHNVDVSPAALRSAGASVSQLGDVHYIGHCADFANGLSGISAARTSSAPMLLLFLGSSIGNFDRDGAAGLLVTIRDHMRKGDLFLLGTDLVKPEADLIAAYDDPLGVTAAFNKNVLTRINRELGANFDLSKFMHQARWNSEQKRVEMHLVSVVDQTVRLSHPRIRFHFERGESIHTENSHKYEPQEIQQRLAKAGFELIAQWVDDHAMFATNLLKAS